ncbi:MAG: hypothetical protein QNJ29_11570 [Rhizobiaceae bacterium]|nr:hypothetical protein [Rhizobiaceae bacterium]
MSWFKELTGINYETSQSVYELLSVKDNTLFSHANSKSFKIGELSTPTIRELRRDAALVGAPNTLEEIVADVQQLHRIAENCGALFQVASQFNLLEMTGPDVTPEDGVSIYEYDLTQGPACAIACGAATIYRNYFVPLSGSFGQTSNQQIDCLEELSLALNNEANRYWEMLNGYALPVQDGLRVLNEKLAGKSEEELDDLRACVKIGVQSDAEVTSKDAGHPVTQVFCSALPVAYSREHPDLWKRFAQIILEAAYEGTLLAAARNLKRTGNNKVYLTMLGGGAFGNKSDWIVNAIIRALSTVTNAGLDIKIVSYGSPSSTYMRVSKHFLDN